MQVFREFIAKLPENRIELTQAATRHREQPEKGQLPAAASNSRSRSTAARQQPSTALSAAASQQIWRRLVLELPATADCSGQYKHGSHCRGSQRPSRNACNCIMQQHCYNMRSSRQQFISKLHLRATAAVTTGTGATCTAALVPSRLQCRADAITGGKCVNFEYSTAARGTVA